MSDRWSLVRVEDLKAQRPNSIAIGPFGSRMKSDRYTESGVPIIRGTNLTGGRAFSGEWVFVSEDTANELRTCIVTAGDLVFPHRGAIGEVGIVPGDRPYYLLSSSLMKLSCDTSIVDPLFLFYFFKSSHGRHQLLKHASQVGTPGIGQPLNSLRRIEIPLPPLNTQRAISAILGGLDDKIELNWKLHQTLEQIVQATFRAWFVDFFPVRVKAAARAQGRDPIRAAMCTMSGKLDATLDRMSREQHEQLAATAALFPDELVDSFVGEIPKGWSPVPVGKVLESTIGGDWGSETPDAVHTAAVRILRGTDLPQVASGNDATVPLRYVHPGKLERRSLLDGDLVLEVSGGSKSQPTGRTLYITDGILERLGKIVEPASFCRRLRPKRKEEGLLLAQHMQHIYARGKTWFYQNQSTGISNFQTSVFLEKEIIVLPQGPVALAFFQLVRPLLDRMYGAETRTLITLRDTLLPKLLSGEIRVGEAQEFVEATA